MLLKITCVLTYKNNRAVHHTCHHQLEQNFASRVITSISAQLVVGVTRHSIALLIDRLPTITGYGCSISAVTPTEIKQG